MLGKIAIKLAENFGFQRRLHLVADFLQGRPNVLEINVLAVFAFAERFFAQVNIHAAGEREGDDQRRGHQEIRFDALMHAGFEIAIAGKDRGGDKIVFGNGFINRRGQRAGIANAGGAAVADEIEAELVEVWLQAGLVR